MKSKRTDARNKFAVVTGATSGIGKAIVKHLAKNDYRVGVISRDTNRLKETVDELLNQYPNQIDVFPTDLSKTDEVILSAHAVVDVFPQIDLLVHVAGIYHNDTQAFYDTVLERYDTETIETTIDVGVTAPMLLTKMLIPRMKRGSSIITISGTFSSAKGWLPYYVSKKALENFTVGLAEEVKDKGIRVNCISPGDTITQSYKKFFPEYANQKYAIEPNDIIDTIQFLTSEKANYITGQIIAVQK
jgi:NAD(P)-dependent dehydrogenase (short-subunit alcohol dehydrogenase family)